MRINEWWLACKATALVGLAALALRVFSLQRVQRVFSPLRRSDLAGWRRDQIVRAVTLGKSVVPGASCLSAALAGVRLLAGAGYWAELRIGVAKDGRGVLRSHAWVECDGDIIIGGDHAGDFVPLAIPGISTPS